MNLEEHCIAFGFGRGDKPMAHDLAYHAKIHRGIAERALEGLPIPKQDHRKITMYVSRRMSDRSGKPDEDYEIEGLEHL